VSFRRGWGGGGLEGRSGGVSAGGGGGGVENESAYSRSTRKRTMQDRRKVFSGLKDHSFLREGNEQKIRGKRSNSFF